MHRLAIAALAAAFAVGGALAQSTATLAADTGDEIRDSAVKAGTAVKEGAVKVGETVKEGAEKVGSTVKRGAIDLWEAGKAAVSAGSDTFDKRRAARDQGKNPDAGNK
jgi:hypothetical protein